MVFGKTEPTKQGLLLLLDTFNWNKTVKIM